MRNTLNRDTKVRKMRDEVRNILNSDRLLKSTTKTTFFSKFKDFPKKSPREPCKDDIYQASMQSEGYKYVE